MLEQTIIKQAAPTIAGIKVANLFPYAIEKNENLNAELEQQNTAFLCKGIRTIIIGNCPACPLKVLLYTYRPVLLKKILEQNNIRTFLTQYGYRKDFSIEQCLNLLSQRICPEQPFPHEIGVFLGYPLADVIGFINNKGLNYLSNGVWKVYSNREQAEKMFQRFKLCTQIYCKCYANGKNLYQLAVAV